MLEKTREQIRTDVLLDRVVEYSCAVRNAERVQCRKLRRAVPVMLVSPQQTRAALAKIEDPEVRDFCQVALQCAILRAEAELIQAVEVQVDENEPDLLDPAMQVLAERLQHGPDAATGRWEQFNGTPDA